MSNQNQPRPDDGIPSFEPWLGVASASLVPAALALFLPPVFLIPLIVATVGLFALSLAMWWRQGRSRQGAEP
jgi:hypothetical protein